AACLCYGDPSVHALYTPAQVVEHLPVLCSPGCEGDFALRWSVCRWAFRGVGGGGGARPAAGGDQAGEPSGAGQAEQLAAVDGEAWIVLHWTTPSCSCGWEG